MHIVDPRQKIALSGVVASLFFSFSYILIALLYIKFDMPTINSPVEKQMFTWQCILFAAIPLAAGQLAVMARKLLQPSSLDGESMQDGSRLDIHTRFVRDTMVHLLLFIVVLFNVAPLLEGDFLRLMPVLTSWFIFTRIFYWFAYLISPPHRIFGTAATMAPNIFFLVFCMLHLFNWI